MLPPAWQLQTPLDAIIFDCDGTLSTIEGIDTLADANGTASTVKDLTSTAMSTTGLTTNLYQHRLDLVTPTRQQIESLATHYYNNLTPDTQAVIQLFHHLNKPVYIVSAGLLPAIVPFGKLLGISKENIFAVDIQFDSSGNFIDYDNHSPLTQNNGKRFIVQNIMMKYPRIGYIGDGLNDYAVYDLVTRFIGYGGIYYRQNIEALCEYYIRHPSMATILPLLLTQTEYSTLDTEKQILYMQGLKEINV